MFLCRHYVRKSRRSVLVATPELRQVSQRSSCLLGCMGNMQNSPGSSEILSSYETNSECYLLKQVGARKEPPALSEYFPCNPCNEILRDTDPSSYRCGDSADTAGHSFHSSLASQSGLQRAGDRLFSGSIDGATRFSFTSNNESPNSESHALMMAKADIKAGAEKTLYTFLLPGSEREIVLPQNILIDMVTSIEEEGRDDPEVFEAAKLHTFQAMERDAFPSFLRSKPLGNLVPLSLLLRLCVGLLGMFGGFWAGFSCILLDKPIHIRCWVSSNSFPGMISVTIT